MALTLTVAASPRKQLTLALTVTEGSAGVTVREQVRVASCAELSSLTESVNSYTPALMGVPRR